MEAHTAALEEVEQVGLRPLGDLPDGARLDGDILRLGHVLEDGDGVAGEFEDHGELGHDAVQLAQGFLQRFQVRNAPELLGFADVGVDHEGDETVRIGLFLEKRAVDPDLERALRPHLDDGVLGLAGPRQGAEKHLRLLVGEDVPGGHAPEPGGVIAQRPGEEALDIRRADPHALFGGVPCHFVGRIAED